MSNYIRTKTEHLEIIKRLEKEVGEGKAYRLPLLRLNQNARYPMFTTKLRTDVCHLLLQRVPRDYNNPDGIQRAFKSDKISDIAKACADTAYTAPGSMIMTVQVKDKDYVSLEETAGGDQGFLVVDLPNLKARLEAAEVDENDFILDETDVKIGFMIDAHHRTEGHYQGGKMDLEMSATCYMNLPRTEMARVFAGVNEHQDKPSPTHTIAMRAMAGMLEGDEKEAVQIANNCNKNPDSILYQRIKEFDGRVAKGSRPTYVNIKSISTFMSSSIVPYMPGLNIIQKEKVVDDYFRGWSEVFPTAWEDEKKHVLVKSMGFTLMCRLFERIYNIAKDHNGTSSPNADDFAQVLRVMFAGKPLLIDSMFGGGGSVELDWSSETFGSYSSGKGINALGAALVKHAVDNRDRVRKELK